MSSRAQKPRHYPKPEILAEAIDYERDHVIEASAGTGKTYTIEHLVLDLILRGVPLREILLVTFTEKATDELRQRLRGKLEELITGEDKEPPRPGGVYWRIDDHARKLLHEALFDFDAAAIHTIHGFCNRVMREFAFENHQYFEQEQTPSNALFDEVFHRSIRRLLSEPENELSVKLQAYLETEPDGLAGLKGFASDLLRFDRAFRPAPADDIRAVLLEALVPEIHAAIAAEKERLGLIDFDDMIRSVADRLKAEASSADRPLTRALRHKYRYALIDEFQDTDEKQWAIFSLLFLESEAHRLFLIGDPKQAIYGFRGADVHTYLEAREALVKRGGNRVSLGENYRSSAAMIEGVNRLFAHPSLFSGAIDFTRVACGKPDNHPAGDPTPPIKIYHLQPTDAKEKLKKETVYNTLAAHYMEAIRNLLDDPAPCLPAKGAPTGYRRVQANDIALLVRGRSDAEFLGQTCTAARIPYAFYKQSGLFQTLEAQHLYDLLWAVERPFDNAACFKALLTDFYPVALGDLLENPVLPETRSFSDKLIQWRAQVYRNGDFRALFNGIFAETRIFERLLFLHDGERQVTNYEHLADILKHEAVMGNLDLRGLLKIFHGKIEGRLGNDEDLLKLETEHQAVQIMTIHASKGLEFPFVFMFGGLTARNAFDYYEFHENGRRVIDLAKRDDAKQAHKTEQKEEDERLYYVGLTRAKYGLHLPYFEKADYARANGPYVVLRESIEQAAADPRDQFQVIQCLTDDAPEVGAAPGRIAEGGRLEEIEASTEREPDYAAVISSKPRTTLSSYTRLKKTGAEPTTMLTLETPRQTRAVDESDEPTAEPTGALPKGAETGNCLHELLEYTGPLRVARHGFFQEWLIDPAVVDVVAPILDKYGLGDFREAAMTTVWHALQTPLGKTLPAVSGLRDSDRLHEVEFYFPIDHAGSEMFLNGSIDLAFRVEGKAYFADWKSDTLPLYDKNHIAEKVNNAYRLQLKIYVLAMCRWLKITDQAAYEKGFGGCFYLFLRGMAEGKGDGVYFFRPSWREVTDYGRELEGMVS